ncbi:hypothetical protein QDY71_08570 [Kingella negevensis]|nr:hypothetical protein [Kingella negevensis]MDK4697799.1 hypothetical protein [Kingella negevensis]
MTRKSYPTDLTDAQWQAIEPHFNQLRHYWHWFKKTFNPSKTSNANLCHY